MKSGNDHPCITSICRRMSTTRLERHSPCVSNLDHAPSAGLFRGRPRWPWSASWARPVLRCRWSVLVIMIWERKWEPVLLIQAPSRFTVLGPAPCRPGPMEQPNGGGVVVATLTSEGSLVRTQLRPPAKTAWFKIIESPFVATACSNGSASSGWSSPCSRVSASWRACSSVSV